MSASTIYQFDRDELLSFRGAVLDRAKTEMPELDSDVFYQLEYILEENITDSVLEYDNYTDDYDDDYTIDEDIAATLKTSLEDVANAAREQDDFIHESVDSSSTLIYTSEYQEFYMDNTRECHEAMYSYGTMDNFGTIDDAIQFSVYLVLSNALREDFETLADWLEELDPADVL